MKVDPLYPYVGDPNARKVKRVYSADGFEMLAKKAVQIKMSRENLRRTDSFSNELTLISKE